MTRVVNLRRGHQYDVYIGRAGNGQDGYFGNPFPLAPDYDRERVVSLYRDYFAKRILTDAEFKSRVERLRGKALG